MKSRKNIVGLLLGMMLLVLAACGGEETASIAFEEGQEVFQSSQGENERSDVLTAETQAEDEESDLAKKQTRPSLAEEAAEMQVHFIDVGQGDATLLICDQEAMLIDAGDDSKGTAVQNYLKKQGVSRLKYLVLTHTDADHIGGSDVIISKFQVDNIFIGNFPKENKVYGDLMDALEGQGYPWSTPEVGSTYTLGTAEITILAPNKNYDDPNNCSIALLVENGEDSFLFTGDAEEEAEADILHNGLSVDCDVFKAGHHGSKTSNSEAFLKAASPEMVVISCGEDNSYGHPHAGPLNTFRNMGIKVYRTDEQGSIIATSTGDKITWNTAPSDTWQAGEPKGSSSSQTGQTSASQSQSSGRGATAGTRQTNEETSNPAAVQASNQATISAAQTPKAEEPASAEQAPAEVQIPAEQAPVTPEPTPVTEPATGTLVWKSATGEKYHSINNCGRMNPDKATQLTKEQAENMGLGPCSKCY